MQKVKVKVTLFVDVEMPDDMTEAQIKFALEENSCPGTGSVGAVIDQTMFDHDASSTCWACALEGENSIVSIEVVA